MACYDKTKQYLCLCIALHMCLTVGLVVTFGCKLSFTYYSMLAILLRFLGVLLFGIYNGSGGAQVYGELCYSMESCVRNQMYTISICTHITCHDL